jgi:hypothetical protein
MHNVSEHNLLREVFKRLPQSFRTSYSMANSGEPKSIEPLETSLLAYERITEGLYLPSNPNAKHVVVRAVVPVDDGRYAGNPTSNGNNSTKIVTATSTTCSREKTQKVHDPKGESDSDEDVRPRLPPPRQRTKRQQDSRRVEADSASLKDMRASLLNLTQELQVVRTDQSRQTSARGQQPPRPSAPHFTRRSNIQFCGWCGEQLNETSWHVHSQTCSFLPSASAQMWP